MAKLQFPEFPGGSIDMAALRPDDGTVRTTVDNEQRVVSREEGCNRFGAPRSIDNRIRNTLTAAAIDLGQTAREVDTVLAAISSTTFSSEELVKICIALANVGEAARRLELLGKEVEVLDQARGVVL